MKISWLTPKSTFDVGGTKVGDFIYRTFRHDYNMKIYEVDPRTKIKKLKSSKDGCDLSIERYTIVTVDARTVTISELGRKSDGTYGNRVYDRSTGRCLDDAVPPSNKSRRSIKAF